MSVRQNYVLNPACATTKWGVDASGVAYTRETAPPVPLPDGFVACTKIVHSSGAWQTTNLTDIILSSPGDVWTFSVFGHCSALSGEYLYLVFTTYNGATVVRDSVSPLQIDTVSAEFVPRQFSVTMEAGEDRIQFGFFVGSGVGTYYLTGGLVEKSAEYGSYFDGSTVLVGKTYAWIGSPNASASTETPWTDLYTYQSAIDAGGVVTIPPGSYTQSAPLMIPPEQPLSLRGYDVAVVLDSGVCGFALLDTQTDYETFTDIDIRGFSVDARLGGYCVIGAGPVDRTSWRTNISGFTVADLVIAACPTRIHFADSSTHQDGIRLVFQQSEGDSTPVLMDGIEFSNVHVWGGNLGFLVCGFGVGENLYIDNVVFENCSYTASPMPVEYAQQNGFQVGSYSLGGSLSMRNCVSNGAGDCGFEVNNLENILLEDCHAYGAGAIGFFAGNYNTATPWETQSITYRHCSAVAPSAEPDRGDGSTWGFGSQRLNDTSIGDLLYQDCSTAGYPEGKDFAFLNLTSTPIITDAPVVSLDTIDAKLDAVLLKTNTFGGAGALPWRYTLTTNGTTPIPDAEVWVTSDGGGRIVIASGRTNAYGVVTFYLDAGTVYVWSQKSGYNFANPDTEVVA